MKVFNVFRHGDTQLDDGFRCFPTKQLGLLASQKDSIITVVAIIDRAKTQFQPAPSNIAGVRPGRELDPVIRMDHCVSGDFPWMLPPCSVPR